MLLNTGLTGPRGKVLQEYYLPDLSPAADQCSTLLADQMGVWTRTIKWLLKHWQSSPFGELDSKTAHRNGFLEKRIRGFPGYPQFRMGALTGAKLWYFFHPESGGHQSLRYAWNRAHMVNLSCVLTVFSCLLAERGA